MTMAGVAKEGNAPKGDLCLLFSFAIMGNLKPEGSGAVAGLTE